MTRLRREESQARTRERLLDAALRLFTRHGYANTSVERIADEAGYSKGAVYSNFDGKARIYLEVLARYGEASLTRLLSAIDRAPDPAAAIEAVADWADATAKSGNWALLVLDFVRSAEDGERVRASQENIFRTHWRTVGTRLAAILNLRGVEPELLGALVFEHAYAPAMTFVSRPTAGDLIRLTLGGLLRAHGAGGGSG